MRPKTKFVITSAVAVALHLVAILALPWATLRLQENISLTSESVTLSLEYDVFMMTTCLNLMDSKTICIDYLYDTVSTVQQPDDNRRLQEDAAAHRRLTTYTCADTGTDNSYYIGRYQEIGVHNLTECCDYCLRDTNCNFYYYYTSSMGYKYCSLCYTNNGYSSSFWNTYTRGYKNPNTPSSQQPSLTPSVTLPSAPSANTSTNGTSRNDMVCKIDGTGHSYYTKHDYKITTSDCCGACKNQTNCSYYYFYGTDCYLLNQYSGTAPSLQTSYTRGYLLDPSAATTYDYDCGKGVTNDLLRRFVYIFQGTELSDYITSTIEPWLTKAISPYIAPLCEAYELLIGFALGPIICCGVSLIAIYVCMACQFYRTSKAISCIPSFLAILVFVMWWVQIAPPLQTLGFSIAGYGFICHCGACIFYFASQSYVSRHAKLSLANKPVVPLKVHNQCSVQTNHFFANLQERVFQSDY